MNDLEDNAIARGQICRTAHDSYRATGFGLSSFPALLKRIIQFRCWERRELVTEDGTPKGRVIELGSLRELITEKPIRGWGEDPRKIEAVIKDDPEALAMFRAAMVEQPGRRAARDISDNVTNKTSDERGNSRAYSIARVQRECDEDTIAAVMAGEMSPNAALVKAGVRENRQVYLPKDPAKAAAKLREQFGDEFVVAVVDAMLASREGR